MTRLRLSPLLLLVCCVVDLHAQVPPVDFANQGFSMRLRYSNVGSYGHVACPPFNPGNPGGCVAESLGLEYPVGSGAEHLYGAGIWIGGKLDTATSGVSPQLRLASVTYEGWAGPYYEFYPGNTPADTIWQVGGGAPQPPGWGAYWGPDLPYRPFADDNRYCRYDDTSVLVAGHVPLRLKVIHSSYAWNEPGADGIHIVEFRITNTGPRIVDSAYIGVFLGPDMFPSPHPGNCYAYIPSECLALCKKALDSIPAPFGVAFIDLPLPQDSIRRAFQLFTGPNTPSSDEAKYAMLSSGAITPDDCPSPDMCIVSAVGPFTLFPAGTAGAEPLLIAVAFLSSSNAAELPLCAQRARELYLQGTDVRPSGSGHAAAFALLQNYPNPFNGETRIGYRVRGTGGGVGVTLKVYDVLGKEVATLVEGLVEAGYHTATFAAGNLPGGVYYYRLSVGGAVETKAMLLVR